MKGKWLVFALFTYGAANQQGKFLRAAKASDITPTEYNEYIEALTKGQKWWNEQAQNKNSPLCIECLKKEEAGAK